MTDEPLTEKDFENHPFGTSFNLNKVTTKGKVQSAKRLMQGKIEDNFKKGIISTSQRVVLLCDLDTCFQIPDGDEG